ncbi:MAG: asparagine synthase (glutamine-hydrolyzing) [Butyrivibrio sp.]|uniref:asparagine synthase (glutamine-hydrolyzing) n=1 Tax=Butyrivibrio sp. TaxID=28121 RepID=UPI0025B899FA|nr:asparagine synthase (glutamine-hydrolyzing) [Butyrivibrio sp.]MBQ6587257.1 asparagine synthase (glutamine-hydrolyzing) [Butyrivibrio sp.]
MCGIAGFYNNKINRAEVIRKMTDRMVHRGPDAQGHWLDEQSGWTLGHRRLSILDLSESGAQPMVSHSGRFVISYNGEIYNVRELKDKLVNDGYVMSSNSSEKTDGSKFSFRGTSDTEVLLEGIERYGIKETLKLCKGMFAIAVYDRENKTLQLARDRVGEKPLYYGRVQAEGGESFFAFASDIALFREIPGFRNEMNLEALSYYMLHSYIPAPMSIYQGINKLMPGTILTLKDPDAEPEIEEYWSMVEAAKFGQRNLFTGSEEEATQELEKLLRNSISDQMIADVPLGAFLSGGIDSATIVSLMQDMSDQKIKTFTIGFDNPKYNEADYARDISNHLGTDHTEMIISEKEMQEAIPQMGYYFSEPFGDASMIPTYFVSKIARQKVTVSLSGDAGDELFCGYEGYWKCDGFWNKINKIPMGIRQTGAAVLTPFDSIGNPKLHRIIGTLGAQNICQLKDVIFDRKHVGLEKVVTGRAQKNQVPSILSDQISDMELYDMLFYHPDDILVKVDRAGMAVSLENRMPMLDRDVIEFAWRIPTQYKYSDGVSKRVLRNILYKYVPKEMMERPKQGFAVPLEKWLKEGQTREWAQEMIDNSKLIRDGILDGKIVRYCWNYIAENPGYTKLVWNMLMAEQWYRG